ncbi:MAG: DUF2007 domain-containing protein [Bacteroidales bacterium]|nr:DUF2007 domain-containing protein [Bacteroidales bacterium]
MDEKYEVAYRAGKMYEAELIKGLLLENGIEAVLMNKRDSEFLIGDVEVLVPVESMQKALELINKQKNGE